MSNPYAACLGNRDARAVLASTPGLLQQALATLSPERIAAPIALGKWSPREIVAHLADCELAHSFRLRQILAAPAAEALELFRANRLWNLKLVGTLSEADFDRPTHHPERGNLTLRIQLETMAGHDLNHLVQLQRLSVTQA